MQQQALVLDFIVLLFHRIRLHYLCWCVGVCAALFSGVVTDLGSCALTCLWHKLWYRSTLRKPWFRTRWQIMSMRLHTWPGKT